MKYATKLLAGFAAAALLTSCGGRDGARGQPESASSPARSGAVADFPQKIGAPYQIDGKSYTPEDVSSYDDVGYASYYGAELAGRPTANGEIFNPAGISGAHKTLPLPSYAEVTALETGRTILVRINDRGPFANDRVVDLSEGAARQLGILDQGIAGVRIRKVSPPEQERAALRSGSAAGARLDTPESLLKVLRTKLAALPKPTGGNQTVPPVSIATGTNIAPTGLANRDGRFVREGTAAPVPPSARPAARTVSTRQPAPAHQAVRPGNDGFVREGPGRPSGTASAPSSGDGSGYIVQLSAFSSRSRADTLARKLGANVAVSSSGGLFRVRYGPYATEAEAQTALAKAQQRGYPQAKIFRE